MRAWQLGRGPAAYASRLTNPVIRRLQIRYGVALWEGREERAGRVLAALKISILTRSEPRALPKALPSLTLDPPGGHWSLHKKCDGRLSFLRSLLRSFV